MSARVWTRKEFRDRQHEARRHDVWVSTITGAPVVVSVVHLPMAEPYRADPPPDVALAVILASKGLDSREAMAAAMDVEAQNHREWAGPTAPTGRANTSERMSESAAVADAYGHAAAMLRRGTVQP